MRRGLKKRAGASKWAPEAEDIEKFQSFAKSPKSLAIYYTTVAVSATKGVQA